MTLFPALAWLKRHKHYLLAFLIQLLLAGVFVHNWDGFVLATSAQQFLQGVTPYQTAFQAPAYTFSPSFPWRQEWYAYPPLPLLLYTPLYALYFFSPLSGNPVAERIFLKLPFILGNLLCAYLVYKYIAPLSEKRARKAELLLLYNPFLIFVAAVWGMFDIWILNFLLLSLLHLRRNRLFLAGVFFALSLLTKPISLIFAPLLLAHLWNKTRRLKGVVLWLSAASGTFAVVSLPFFLSQPQGFFQQVFLMHLSRLPQGWTPLHLFSILSQLDQWQPFTLSFLKFSTLAVVLSNLFTLLLPTALLTFVAYYLTKRETQEKELLSFIFLTTAAFLLLNKVVNPQYFVLPIGLAVTLLFSYQDYDLLTLRQVDLCYRFITFPFLFATILMSSHFLTFIPEDISLKLWGQSALELLRHNIPPRYLNLYGTVIATASVAFALPIAIKGWLLIYTALRKTVPFLARTLRQSWLGQQSRIIAYALKRPMLVSLIVFLLLATISPAIRAVYSPPESPPLSPYQPGTTPEDKLVGVFYYWWENPSHDPGKPYGSWQAITLTPQEGYYESTYAYIKKDIAQMKEGGIDFAIVPLNWFRFERYMALARAVTEEDFLFAPLLDLSDLADSPDYLAVAPFSEPFSSSYLSLTEKTRKQIEARLNLALKVDSSTLLTYKGKPVVFFRHHFNFSPGWSTEEKQFLAETLLSLYSSEDAPEKAFEALSQAWGIEMENLSQLLKYYPRTPQAFYQPQNQIEQDWLRAYQQAWREMWKAIREDVAEQNGELFWIGDQFSSPELPQIKEEALFDSHFFFPSFTGKGKQVDSLLYWNKVQEDLSSHTPVLWTVTPAYKEGAEEIPVKSGKEYSYDLLWQIALSYNPNFVLIASWNQYQQSSAIEPTVEWGEVLWQKTAFWSKVFKGKNLIIPSI